MLLGGLWHGANWTFVVWGGIHGAGLAIERLFRGKQSMGASSSFIGRWGRRIVIFNLVCLAWIFFRVPTLDGALNQIRGLATWQWNPVYLIAFQFVAIYALALFLVDLELERSNSEYIFASRSLFRRVTVGFALCVLITLFGANQENAFIYFRF
jgi:hypothetical protein